MGVTELVRTVQTQPSLTREDQTIGMVLTNVRPGDADASMRDEMLAFAHEHKLPLCGTLMERDCLREAPLLPQAAARWTDAAKMRRHVQALLR